MAKKPKHVIQRYVFDVEVGSKEEGLRAHNDFTDAFYKVVIPLLEQILDQYDSENEIIKIDRLEIDLGELNTKILETDLKHMLDQRLRRALIEKIAMLPPKQITTREPEGRIPLIRSRIELLLYVLEYGNLPPWADRSNYQPQALLEELIASDKFELISAIASLVSGSPSAAKRLATQFPVSSIEMLVDALFASSASVMQSMVETMAVELAEVFGTFSLDRRKAIAREAFLMAIFSQATLNFSRPRIVNAIREILFAQYKVFPHQILQGEALTEGQEAEMQRQLQEQNAQLLLQEARKILSGQISLTEWLEMPEDLQVRLWEYLLTRLGNETVSFLLNRMKVRSADSSVVNQAWNILVKRHTESLRKALVQSGKVFEGVQMILPVMQAESLPELLDWLLPGQERQVGKVIETLLESFRKQKKTILTETQFRDEVLKALVSHFSEIKKTGFTIEETLKALQQKIAKEELPKEVLDHLVENQEDFKKENYQELPPMAAQAIRLSPEEELFRYLRHVMIFGEAPWWSPFSLSDFEPELVKLAETPGIPFKEFFQSITLKATTPAQQRSVVKVLLAKLSLANLNKVLEVVEPEMVGFLVTVQLTIQRLFQLRGAPSIPSGDFSPVQYPWKPILGYLLNKGRKETQTSDLVDYIVFQLAADLRKSKAEVRSLLLQTAQAEVLKGEGRFRAMESMLTAQAANDAQRPAEALAKEEEVKIAQLLREAEVAQATEAEQVAKREAIKALLEQKFGRTEAPAWKPEEWGMPPASLTEIEAQAWLKKRQFLIESGAGDEEPPHLTAEELRIWKEARQTRIIQQYGDSKAFARDDDGFILTDAKGQPILIPVEDAQEALRLVSESFNAEIQKGRDMDPEVMDQLRDKELEMEETIAEIKRKAQERADELAQKAKQAEQFALNWTEEDLLPGKPFEILIQFLQSGTIPSDLGNISRLEFENMLLTLVDERPRELRALLQDRLRTTEVRRRVAKAIPLFIQEELIGLLKPAFARNLMEFSEKIAEIFRRPGSPVSPEIIQEHRLLMAVSSRNISFSPVLYVRELLAYAAKQASKDYLAVILWLEGQLEVLTSGMGAIMERVAAIVSQEKQDLEALEPEARKERQKKLIQEEKKEEKKIDAKKEPIYIKNAGIVIFNRMLPFFFKNLGMLEESGEAFIDNESKERGVFLLHNLLYFKREMEEVELALNKVMCGLDPSHPVTGPYELTEREEKEIVTLFQVVSSRWKHMKDKPADAIRGTILQRDGRLKWDDSSLLSGHWNLRVEQKPYDSILASFPFPYSELNFPWMGTKLVVDWG